MTTPVRNPTLDDAMSEFQAMLREALGDSFSDAATRPMTPEEQEEARYRFAAAVLNLACPDPKTCSHRHCRRKARCRHLARVAAKRASGKVSHPRRTPGAEAARYAVRVLMSSGGEGTGLPTATYLNESEHVSRDPGPRIKSRTALPARGVHRSVRDDG